MASIVFVKNAEMLRPKNLNFCYYFCVSIKEVILWQKRNNITAKNATVPWVKQNSMVQTD